MDNRCPKCGNLLDADGYCGTCDGYVRTEEPPNKFRFGDLSTGKQAEVIIGAIIFIASAVYLISGLVSSVSDLMLNNYSSEVLAEFSGAILGRTAWCLPLMVLSTALLRSLLFKKRWKANKNINFFVIKRSDGGWTCPYCHMENIGSNRCEQCGFPPIFATDGEAHPG